MSFVLAMAVCFRLWTFDNSKLFNFNHTPRVHEVDSSYPGGASPLIAFPPTQEALNLLPSVPNASLLPILPKQTLLQNNTLAIQVPIPILSLLIKLSE